MEMTPVLEYFFVAAREQGLERKLNRLMNDPAFSSNNGKHIRMNVKTVRAFDRGTREERMLRAVVEKFFTAEEIIDFVLARERKQAKDFTIETSQSASSPTLKQHPGKVIASLSRRVYRTRNVFGHNEDDDRQEPLLLSDREVFLELGIPLLKYLAEQIIIRSAGSMERLTRVLFGTNSVGVKDIRGRCSRLSQQWA